MLKQNSVEQIVNDLESISGKSSRAKLMHDLLLKLDTARMELEASPRSPCMDYTCVCLESAGEANLLLGLLKDYAENLVHVWRHSQS